MTVIINGGNADTGKLISKTYDIPGDKSISHRAVMLGAIATGVTEATGFLTGDDCISTINCFRALGVEIEQSGDKLRVTGRGELLEPDRVLDVGNSGTTMRLMAGILAGQPFKSNLTGDESIQKRPMRRITEPLSLMGAKFSGDMAPLSIEGGRLKAINYTLPVASAQVKSAILLAGLYADGETLVKEPIPSRDHTEIMLRQMGARIEKKSDIISCAPSPGLKAINIEVPGDISSAAFIMGLGAIIPGARVKLRKIGVNPTRTGIIDVLRRMGADIRLSNECIKNGEAVADIEVKHSRLKATEISGGEIPTLIDEIPLIAAVALFAEGETVIRDAAELRVKETDRIQVVAEEMGKFFEKTPIVTTNDGMIIKGGLPAHGAKAASRGDHRIAMSLAVTALAASGETEISGCESADISFPGFFKLIPYSKCTF